MQKEQTKKKQKIQKTKLIIGIIVGVIVSIITLFVLFIIFLLLVFFGGPAKVTTNIDKYEGMLSKYSNVQTAFITFPEELPDSAENTDFYFYYKDTWNTPTCEVFLQCTYDESDYQAEVERLENTKKQYGSVERSLLRDEEKRFPYPAYIAVDSRGNAYEYALLSGEREITYIYTAWRYEEQLKKVDAKYLPSDFDSRQEQTEAGEGYSIYLEKEDGYGWQYDFTRDAVAEVLEYHPVTVDYNYFRVCTRLDENDNKIIQHCEYVYYESEAASYDSLPEEIQYTELKGYQFKSVKLNADKTKAIVTYYDGGEEKTMEYVIPEV